VCARAADWVDAPESNPTMGRHGKIGEQIMTPRKIVKTIGTNCVAFVETLESVIGGIAGTFGTTSVTAEDRLLRRAANDAEQR
jgi:hypothetical protein